MQRSAGPIRSPPLPSQPSAAGGNLPGPTGRPEATCIILVRWAFPFAWVVRAYFVNPRDRSLMSNHVGPTGEGPLSARKCRIFRTYQACRFSSLSRLAEPTLDQRASSNRKRQIPRSEANRGICKPLSKNDLHRARASIVQKTKPKSSARSLPPGGDQVERQGLGRTAREPGTRLSIQSRGSAAGSNGQAKPLLTKRDRV